VNLLNPLFLLPWAILAFFAVRFVASTYFKAGSRANAVAASVVGAFVVGALLPNFRLWDAGPVAERGAGSAGAPAPAATPTASPVPVVEHPYEGDPNADKAPPVTWDEKRGAFVQLGRPLQTARLWRFAGTTEGFSASPGTQVAPAPGGGLVFTNGEYGSYVRTPSALMLDGGHDPVVLIRLTRLKAGAGWSPVLYYSTDHHGEVATMYARVYRGKNPRVGQTVTLVFDMAKLGAGNDWTSSRINQIRLQTDDQPGGEFVIREIAISRPLFR
jgi:hypothetical protein